MLIQDTKAPKKPEEVKEAAKVSRPWPWFVILLLALVVVSAAAAVYFYLEFNKLRLDQKGLSAQEVEALLQKVSRLIVLPEDEKPTVATVADPQILQDQPFFARAKKGDRVLIYAKAGKAILYDPVADKIVEVAPLNFGLTPTSTSQP